MPEQRLLEVKVWGELACFTRPEMKVERVSYPVMTPSAARGLLEAIFWKPEIKWQIREIWVLRPIRQFSILRNEVKSKAVFSTAVKGAHFYAEQDRAQRHSLILRDVMYIIRAHIVLQPGVRCPVQKYRDMFARRLDQGQCFHRPCLGCREFAASFAAPNGSEVPIDFDSDLGLMLFDLDYESGPSGRGTPRFFHAQLRHGILHIPPQLYRKEVTSVAESAR
jgi:CRISPR-associated protein Cas5d